MKLLTKTILKTLPPLRSQDNLGRKAVAYVKFFTPDSNWTWYVMEYDGDDLFFGLVAGHATEFGYFTLAELKEALGPYGLHIERDMYWEPRPVGEIAPELFR